MANIKIFTIATNNYKNFLNSFLNSFGSLFLPNYEKEFHVFIDDINYISDSEYLFKYKVKHEKWPFITLNRYKFISELAPKIENDDLCIFADIDLEIVRPIDTFHVDKLFGVNHPGNYYVDNIISLEDNPNSLAYVDKSKLPDDYQYIQGCFWGGTGECFLKLINCLYNNTRLDYENNVVAKWHDESHLNKYLIENFNDFTILPSSFAFPQNWSLNIPKFIIHKDKNMSEYPRFEGSKN